MFQAIALNSLLYMKYSGFFFSLWIILMASCGEAVKKGNSEKNLSPEIPLKLEKLAEGFSFTEGPVWHPDGYLLFSDPNMNTIYRYNPANSNVTVYMSHSGYTGADIDEYHQPGSNGLAIDKEGRLIIDQHGNRRLIRIEKNI